MEEYPYESNVRFKDKAIKEHKKRPRGKVQALFDELEAEVKVLLLFFLCATYKLRTSFVILSTFFPTDTGNTFSGSYRIR